MRTDLRILIAFDDLLFLIFHLPSNCTATNGRNGLVLVDGQVQRREKKMLDRSLHGDRSLLTIPR